MQSRSHVVARRLSTAIISYDKFFSSQENLTAELTGMALLMRLNRTEREYTFQRFFPILRAMPQLTTETHFM